MAELAIAGQYFSARVIACVSRAPIKPNAAPNPPGLDQRTTAGMRLSAGMPGKRATMVSCVPNGRTSVDSMNIPPKLKSLAKPLIAGRSLSSQLTEMSMETRG